MAARTVAPGVLRIRGLAELQKELRAAGPQYARQLRHANKAAAETVADVARQRAQALGGVAAKVASSIRAVGEQRYAKLVFGGGARLPMAFGANFGAYHDRERYRGSTKIGPHLSPGQPAQPGAFRGYNQFEQWGGNQFTGGARDRFLYWAISRQLRNGEFEQAYTVELDRVLRHIAPEGKP